MVNVIKAVRTLRSAVNLANKIKPAVFIRFSTKSTEQETYLTNNSGLIAHLGNCQPAKFVEAVPKGCLKDFVNNNLDVCVQLDAKFVDIKKEVGPTPPKLPTHSSL